MDHVTSRDRRRLTVAIKDSLRDLSVQLSLYNRQVGARVDLKDLDWDCLEILKRQGALSPTALARQSGLHPATMTGVVDRLERGGWAVRERDPADRRGILVRALKDRNAELIGLLSGMNDAMDDVCGAYTDEQLELVADFLRRTTQAGETATAALD
jgi:DNA-binding MarR family transcriptional regulator